MDVERTVCRTIDGEDGGELRQALAERGQLRELIAVGDDRARAAVLQAELERLLAEEREERDGDHPRLPRGEVRDRRLVALREQDRDAVAALQAAGDEDVCESVGEGV